MHPPHLHGDAAPRQALLQHAHVAAIAVQIQQVGHEVGNNHGGSLVGRLLGGAPPFGRVFCEADRPSGGLVHRSADAASRFHGVKGLVHGGQRGVVRNGVHAGVGRQRALGRQASRLGKGRIDVAQNGVDARVLQPYLQVVGSGATSDDREPFLVGQLLEIDVPNPRNVVAVGHLVVDEERHHLGRRVGLDDLEVLVEARGVLRQVQQHRATVDGVALQAPVARVEGVDGLLQRRRGNARLLAQRVGGQQIVGSVGRGLGRVDGLRSSRARHVHGHAGGRQANIAAHEGKRRPGEIARLAVVIAQLAVLAEAIGDHAVALLAHLRIGHGVLGQVHRFRQAEGNRAVRHLIGNARAQRIVAVVYQHGFRRAFQRLNDGALDAVDLTAAIQLIAEEVQQHHVGRAQARQHAGEPQLVALEHAPLGGRLLQQRRGNARGQVRTGAVADNSTAIGLEGIGQQVVRGSLPVGAHGDNRALGALVPQLIQQRGVDLQGDFPRQVRRRAVGHMLQAPGGHRAGRLRQRKTYTHASTSLVALAASSRAP